MQNYVRISNSIFQYKLSPKAIFVYAYLCFRMNSSSFAKCKLTSIASACNISIKTVLSAIDELEKQGLIIREHCYRNRQYTTNLYKVLFVANHRWFKVDSYIFKTNIKPPDFVVYSYIISRMNNKELRAFPSLSTIAKDTNISKGRVSQAVKFLCDYTYLNRVKRHYKQTKAYRHNKYLHFSCNLSPPGIKSNKSKRASLHFPLCRGSTQITNPLLYPHLFTNKREKTIIYNLN